MLGNNIFGLQSGKDYCIKISANDVVLDGNGFSITGSGNNFGIYVIANNVTIRNLKVSSYEIGIHLSNSNNNIILNNTISGNGYGIYL